MDDALAILLLAAVLAVSIAALAVTIGVSRYARAQSERSNARGKRIEEFGNKLLVTSGAETELREFEERTASRLDRLERELRRIAAGLEELAAREPASQPVIRVGEEVEPLLREVIDVLEGRIRAVEAALSETQVESVPDAVRRALRERGFGEVAILEGPQPDGERFRVLVEARKEGMTFKGPVFLSGTNVVEQRLSPSYPMFP